MKKITFFFAFLFISITYAQNITLQEYATGLSNPLNLKHAGDDRLFVVERDGLIKIINTDGSINPTPFLNIDPKVTNNGGEQGLLAVAFHPNFASNGYFYVNYINTDENTIIARYTANTNDTADVNSEVILISLDQPYVNHNGGDLHFGTDGYLYISLGDGGAGGDPQNYAQNTLSLLGKMLRIDVDNTSNGNEYAIPADNPFVGDPDGLDEIWAYGLRNPFKFSFDRSNGNLWIADVGQETLEEINRVPASSSGGENYGWKCFEGNMEYSDIMGCESIVHQEPVAVYDHTGGRCSITGGYVYRGTQQPMLQGLYFFADYCSNVIGYVDESTTIGIAPTFLDTFPSEGWSAFGEDVNGELYIVGLSSGNVYKILENTLSVAEYDLSHIKMYPNPSNAMLNFDLSECSMPVESISFYDLQGKVIQTKAGFDSELISISTEKIASGLYIVEIASTGGNTNIRKLIVN